MGDYWVNIALVAVLILLNAVFAGSEIALISLREGQVRRLDRRGGAAARGLVRLARDPNRFLATIQVGITLAGFLASATAAVSLARPLVAPLGLPGRRRRRGRGRARDGRADLRHPRAWGSWRPSGSACSSPSGGRCWSPARWTRCP